MSSNHQKSPSKPDVIQIATYNCRSFPQYFQDGTISDMLTKNIDILALTEVRRQAPSARARIDDAITLIHGPANPRWGGVGILIATNNFEITSFNFSHERLGHVKLLHTQTRRKLCIIVVYAPHNAADENEKEVFYEQLQEMKDEVTRGNEMPLIILGDFNGEIGREVDKCHGINSLAEIDNDNGQRLRDFSNANDLNNISTYFAKRDAPSDLDAVKKRYYRKKKWGKNHQAAMRKAALSYVDQLNQFTEDADADNDRFVKIMLKIRNAAEQHERAEDADADNDRFVKIMLKIRNAAEQHVEKESRYAKSTLLLILKRKELLNTIQASNATSPNFTRMLIELTEMGKTIRKMACNNLKTFKLKKMIAAIENRRSIKKAKRDMIQGSEMIQIPPEELGQFFDDLYKLNNKEMIQSKDALKEFERFSNNLDTTLPFTIHEVRRAIARAPTGKMPGPDKISGDEVKACINITAPVLLKQFNRYLETMRTPPKWKESKVILLYKKGCRKQAGNYRPLSLTSHVYKIFAGLILTRLNSTLSTEIGDYQFGFRRGVSTANAIVVVENILEKMYEHDSGIGMVFVDYSKAFDTVIRNCIYLTMAKMGIQDQLIRLVMDLNKDMVAEVEGTKIKLLKGVRQGCPLSPVLFNIALESIYRNVMTKESGGLKILGRNCSFISYADDTTLIAQSPKVLQSLTTHLQIESAKVGLHINKNKTCLLASNTNTRNRIKPKKSHKLPPNIITEFKIVIDGEEIETVDSFKYLGKVISLDKARPFVSDAKARGWKAYHMYKQYTMGCNLQGKRYIYNALIRPAMCYGCQTWNFTKGALYSLEVTERSILRRIFKKRIWNETTNERLHNTDLYASCHIKRLRDFVIDLKI
uniref:Reverse transcriptase domain-containing protein n=1 Tax=Rhabditophanes sp. KR3021 TaxID=114890 RepID=A0AC35TPZ0_9BILA